MYRQRVAQPQWSRFADCDFCYEHPDRANPVEAAGSSLPKLLPFSEVTIIADTMGRYGLNCEK